MKLSRHLTEVEALQQQARQALMLADQARASGDQAKAAEWEQAAQTFANQLVAAESSMNELKSLHDQALGAATQARKAVENDARLLQQKLAERTKLLSQLEQAKMQESVARSLESGGGLAAPGRAPRSDVRRGWLEDRAPVRDRAGPSRSRNDLHRGAAARGAEGDAGSGRYQPAPGDPGQHGQGARRRDDGGTRVGSWREASAGVRSRGSAGR
jgi:hypothetical protein